MRNAKGQFTGSPGPRHRDPKTGRFAPVLFEPVEHKSGTNWWLVALVVVGLGIAVYSI